jgi:hypothetical protein
MSKSSLALVAVVALFVVTAMFIRSPVARAQGATRFEYLRATPLIVQVPVAPNRVQERLGYRACVAGLEEWKCRTFHSPESTSDADAIRPVLAMLGNEGWELVSAVADAANGLDTQHLTYLFKRSAR